MRKWFILVLTAFLLMGCGICKRVQYIPVEGKRDSVYIERLIVDTITIEIPGETISVVTQDSSYLATEYSVSEAKIDSLGRLHHSLTNKDIKIEKEIVYKEVEVEVEVEKEVPVPVKVPEKYVPEYYKRINILFWSIIAIFLLYLIVKLKIIKF